MLYNKLLDFNKIDLESIKEIASKLDTNQLQQYTNDLLLKPFKDSQILIDEHFYKQYPDKEKEIKEILQELENQDLIKTKKDIDKLKEVIMYIAYNIYFSGKLISNLFTVLDKELTYKKLEIDKREYELKQEKKKKGKASD